MKVVHIAGRSTPDARGTYAIYPVHGCWSDEQFGKLKPEAELGQVKARTIWEAVRIARERKIGEGLDIWAVEVIEKGRITIYDLTEKE